MAMGKSAPAPAPEPPIIKDDGYKWPENLYTEMRDMAAVSFLIYAFAYASDVTREVGLQGLTEKDQIQKSAIRDLPRSFTPQEVLELLETNRETLKTKFKEFEDGPKYDLLMKNLKVLQGTVAYAISILLASAVCAR
jgi:vacuolar-type H+-ATPase subunit C/Vma6